MFEKLDTIVAMTPDMSVTAMYADYVLPVAHHYERHDITMEGRTPYLQVLDQAVPPLGESADDYDRHGAAREGDQREGEGAQAPAHQGQLLRPAHRARLHARCTICMTLDGKIHDTRDIVQFLLDNSSGLPKISYEELAKKGIVRVNDSQDAQFGPKSPFNYKTLASTRDKQPYETLTGRQQYYMDHDWFLAEGEQLPVHKDAARESRSRDAPHDGPRAPRHPQHVARRLAAAAPAARRAGRLRQCRRREGKRAWPTASSSACTTTSAPSSRWPTPAAACSAASSSCTTAGTR